MSLFGDEIEALDDQPEDAGVSAAPQPDTLLEPKSSTLCLGHETQEQLFIELYKNNNLPHAMIFQGLKGIGKTTMAFRLARFLLKNGKGMNTSDGLFGGDDIPQEISSLDVSPDDPVFRRIASGGHADLLYIHRQFDKAKGKQDSTLKVESLRQIEPFLRKTASEGGWRVVIVEDADTMNRNAQNAILKILEEPPAHVLIILITNRPGMLIPTIHSRSRKVTFDSLSPDTMHTLIEKYGETLSHDDLMVLSELSGGSIGEAVNYIDNGGLDIMKDVLDYMNYAHNGDVHKLHELSARLAAPAQDKEYRMFVEILQWVFRKILFLKARNETELPRYIDRPVTQSIIGSYSIKSLLKICDSLKTHFERIEFSNLDRRDAVRSAFLMISEQQPSRSRSIIVSSKDPFYITTAISYVNGVPHLGHAYESILTDVLARFKRLDGYDVKFLTGTDEHGEKVAQTAEKNGMEPKEFADQNAGVFREMTKKLGISNDDFIRTTEERHYAASQAIWKKLEENGDIYLGKYEGWYSVREEAYFTEDELTEGEDGQKYTPLGTEVKWVEEPSYFFKLSSYTDRLIDYYNANLHTVQPDTRMNEIMSFLKQEGGLSDLSISRHKSRLKWGIPVPNDDDHVMYVWLDALTNYITAIGYPDEGSDEFKKFWPANYHVIGKDITRFHAIYWPAFLMSAHLALPEIIFAHGFINVGGAKMSKSVGNVLSPDDLVDTYGLDQIRYFLMREVAHGNDGNFSHEQAVQRINADLANGLGNLAQRTLSMIYKNCEAAIPAPGEFTDEDNALLHKAYTLVENTRPHFDQMKFNRGLEHIWSVVSDCDSYIDAQAPWTLKKTDHARMETVLYVLADVIRCLAIIVQPVMPHNAPLILDQLVIPEDERSFAHISDAHALKAGTAIEKPEGVFPRIVEEEAAE